MKKAPGAKKQQQLKHFINRMWMRLGIHVTQQMHEELLAKIQNYRQGDLTDSAFIFFDRQSIRLSRWLCQILGQYCILVYDSNRKQLVTVLMVDGLHRPADIALAKSKIEKLQRKPDEQEPKPHFHVACPDECQLFYYFHHLVWDSAKKSKVIKQIIEGRAISFMQINESVTAWQVELSGKQLKIIYDSMAGKVYPYAAHQPQVEQREVENTVPCAVTA